MDQATQHEQTRQLRRQKERTNNKARVKLVKTLKLEYCDEELTATSGLGPIIDAFQASPFAEIFAKCLPKRESNRSIGGYQLGLALIASFVYGHDCLDDLEEFREDPHFDALFDKGVPAPRTMGDFLRAFTKINVADLNSCMHQMAMSLRKQLQAHLPEEHKPGALTVDIDSTPHEQTGEKMEGLEINYKGMWCLDSQVTFDELGFAHGVQLRPGATKSGVKAGELLASAFKGLKFQDEKYARGDSAYCTLEVIKVLVSNGVKFTITAHGNIGWEAKVNEVTKWVPWEYTEEQKQKAFKQGKELPVIELGRVYWSPTEAPNLLFPVVIKRTPKKAEQLNLITENQWDYYGIVTNFDLFHHSYQEVVMFHNKRGNAENFIREGKYGYDLKHFGCQKLLANHAYLAIALIAHNFMRWLALLANPSKPNFAKKLRRRLVCLPGKIVSHAKQLVLRIPIRFKEEVERIRKAWLATPIPVFSTV